MAALTCMFAHSQRHCAVASLRCFWEVKRTSVIETTQTENGKLFLNSNLTQTSNPVLCDSRCVMGFPL